MSKKFLILGGNGFIGAEVVEYLSDLNKNYEFILLNRGHWADWDLETRIKPRILENIFFDRKADSFKDSFKSYLENSQLEFEALIDFSGYKAKT
jgi:nucleoside-diphosphate-sugar epimerase